MPTSHIKADGSMDYTSLAAWQTGRAASSLAGDTEEAVLHDATNTETVTFRASLWANNVTLCIRANTPHQGDFTAGTIKTSGLWSFQWNSSTKVCNFEIQDIHFNLASVGAFSSMVVFGPTVSSASLIGTGTVRRPLFSNGTTANSRGVYFVNDIAGASAITSVVENAVADGCSAAAIMWGGSQAVSHNITLRGSTLYESRLTLRRNVAHTYTVGVTGCLFKTPGTDAELFLDGASGTVTATSERVISSRTQAQHEAVFGTRTGNTYSVTFVTGAPSAGQVGFTDITGNDFSLVDDANNLAIDYVTSGTMPALDIAGETRDVTPDCGAFEVVAVGSAPDAPTGFTSGATTHNSLTFTWTDVATTEDDYEVEYQVDGDVGWTASPNSPLAASSTTDTLTGLTAATIYNIRVRATNAFGDSAWLTGQMTTDAAPASTGTRRSGMGLGLGLGLGRSRRGGGGSSASSTLYWSAASSWPGGVPEADEDVTIPLGTTIVLDTDTAALGVLTIEGTLVVQPGAEVSLTADTVMIDGGTLQCGTEASPFSGEFTIELTGPTPSHTTDGEDGSKLNNGLTRAVMVTNGGVLDLHGNVPSVVYTRIGAHIDVSVDDNTITLSEAVDWPVGAKFILSKTDYYSVGDTEELTIAARPDSTTITTVENIAADRWGVMQYATDSGMSLTPGTLTRDDPLTPTTLDERATVALLTRNIVIQGANDTTWSTDGIGGHTMVDDNTCTYRLEGVEFRRMGQKHSKGRYPIHFHMLSWGSYLSPESGDWLGEAPAERFYVKKCAVAGSMNRGCVIHGTHGILVEDNVFFDIKGHAVFEEDGAEEDNIIQRNCAMKVRDPGSGFRIKSHDANASGFWLVNPNNKVRQNIASDCQGRGFWNSFADDPFGLSREVAVEPRFIVIDEFDDNIAHSNLLSGFMTNHPVTNEAGATAEIRYLERYTPGQVHEFTMERNQSWKNSAHGYDNRVMKGLYNYWTMADNQWPSNPSSDFFGVSLLIAKNTGPLLINNSLNNATAKTSTVHNAVASYHFEMDFPSLVAIGYNLQGPEIWANGQMVQGGGVLNTGDLYTNGVYYQLGRSPGWTLIDSDPGHLPLPPLFDGFPLDGWFGSTYRYWTLGVIHDPYGYWTTAGHWILPDRDLYTYGLTTTAISGHADHVSAEAHIYGIERVQTDLSGIGFGNSTQERMIWHRLNTSNASIDTHDVGPGASSVNFASMRSFVANREGRFQLEFPDADLTAIDQLSIVVRLCHKTEDWFLLGLPWDGARVPTRVSLDTVGPTISTAYRTISLTGANIADVLADTTGATGWQDTANDVIWVQVRGTESGSYAHTSPELVESNSASTYARYVRIVA